MGKTPRPEDEKIRKGLPPEEEDEEDEKHEASESEEEEEEERDTGVEDEESEEEEDEEPKGKGKMPARKSLVERLEADSELGEDFLDLSPFLKSVATHQSDALEDFFEATEKRLDRMERKLTKSLNDRLDALQAETDPEVIAKAVRSEIMGDLEEQRDLVKSLTERAEEIGMKPQPPKAVGGYDVLHKGGVPNAGSGITLKQAGDIIEKACGLGLCEGRLVTQFEMNPHSISEDLVKSLATEIDAHEQAGTR